VVLKLFTAKAFARWLFGFAREAALARLGLTELACLRLAELARFSCGTGAVPAFSHVGSLGLPAKFDPLRH